MKVTCETATLADAVGRATRVAPSATSAYHKAAGLLFELDPAAGALVLKSTDLEITYRQQVPVIEAKGEAGSWRVPSALLNGFVAALPFEAGQTVTIEDHDDHRNQVLVSSGRTKARLRLIEGDFPRIGKFDTEGMVEVPDFAQRVQQVAWACHPKDAPLSGVHIDGENLAATDREKVVLVPCPVPVAEPITVPLTTLLGLLRNATSVWLRADGQRLRLRTDDETQASTVIYGVDFPRYKRVLREDHTYTSRIEREVFDSALNRLMVIARGTKLPRIRFTFREASLSLQMAAEDVGVIRDEIDLIDGPSEPWSAWYTPQNFINALAAATKPEVVLRYGPKSLQSLAMEDGTGWRCEVMPRSASTEAIDAEAGDG